MDSPTILTRPSGATPRLWLFLLAVLCPLVVALACDRVGGDRQGDVRAPVPSTRQCAENDGIARVRQSVVGLEFDASAARVSSGTGFFVDQNGLILTSDHLVERRLRASVFVTPKRDIRGLVVSRHQDQDLAVVDTASPTSSPVTWGDDTGLTPGQRLFALGFPEGAKGEAVLSSGSFKSRTTDGRGQYLELDMTLNPGNSGGPVFTACGEVVGIVSFRNLNQVTTPFATSVADARRILGAYQAQATAATTVIVPPPPLPPPPAQRPLPPPPPPSPMAVPSTPATTGLMTLWVTLQAGAPGDCTNVREQPRLAAMVASCLPNRTRVQVLVLQ